MIALVALALAQSTPPVITTRLEPTSRILRDAEACKLLKETSARVMAELPMMIDKITRVDGMSVICALRTTAWNKFIMADASSMRVGWQDRKQSQFNKIVCENAAFGAVARQGWRFTQNMTFQSGERIIIDAKCPRL